jgi:glucose dehydrogenase
LQLAWTHHSGDIGSLRDGSASAYEAAPIFAKETLYFCNPVGRVFALDARNGSEHWDNFAKVFCDFRSRRAHPAMTGNL